MRERAESTPSRSCLPLLANDFRALGQTLFLSGVQLLGECSGAQVLKGTSEACSGISNPRRAHTTPTASPWRFQTEASLFLPDDS